MLGWLDFLGLFDQHVFFLNILNQNKIKFSNFDLLRVPSPVCTPSRTKLKSVNPQTPTCHKAPSLQTLHRGAEKENKIYPRDAAEA